MRYKLFVLQQNIKTYLINALKRIKDFLTLNKIFELSFKFIYIILIIFISINILKFSYKAFLYPIRMSQYFDECSYIAMGKYFRTIPPVDIYKYYVLKDKNIPNIYNEFNCRMIYWPIVLSLPLKYTEDRVELHKFRAFFLSIGTIIFFLLGLRLSGIMGGIFCSVFWFATPLINYWGHFFMSENPSLVFLAIGYLCLLCSDRSTFFSFFGGLFLGIACLTRFTTAALIIPAPFIILAVYFNPFKRKKFQILGELAKLFVGFVVSTLPYFIFTWWLFQNPFIPFISAKFAVNNFSVEDPLYYVHNLWIESGPDIRVWAILSLFSPVAYAITGVIRKILKDKKSHPLYFKKQYESIIKRIRIKNKLFKSIKLSLRYIKVFFSVLISYSIIIVIFIITTSLFLLVISDIPHKLPRYLSGAIIPVIIIASLGIGVLEPLIINLSRLLGDIYLSNFKKINVKIKWLKFVIIPSWIVVFFLSIFFIGILINNIWQRAINRPFNISYKVKEEAIDKLRKRNDKISELRLQPENIIWKTSINERLKEVEKDPKKGIDSTDYFSSFYRNVLNYLEQKMKYDEVFYVDRMNYTPYTPGYAEVPCLLIDYTYGYSIEQLIKKGLMQYKGYVLTSDDVNNDMVIEENNSDEANANDGKIYYRSLSKFNIEYSRRFKFIRSFGSYNLYYYKGKSFPYKFGTIKRIEKLYNNKKDALIENNEKNPKSNLKELFNKMFHSWIELFNQNKKR